jgi:uracil-DNA glycosylase
VTHNPLPPFAGWSGPRRPRMLILGEAWGEHEATAHQPFVGTSGQELFRMLGEVIPDEPKLHREATRAMRYGPTRWLESRTAWLEAVGLAFTNVFALRPPSNALGALCTNRKELPHGYSLPPLGRTGPGFPAGAFLESQYLPELTRLHHELLDSHPTLVVAAGNTALWALAAVTNIGSVRGNAGLCTRVIGAVGELPAPIKFLPTYHPAGVLRQWSWRPIVVADLMKAWRESQWPELRRPERSVIVDPAIGEVYSWVRETLYKPPALLACDIETGNKQIKCIGFARSRSEAIVIPFVDLAHGRGSYWPNVETELEAWRLVQRLLESGIPKVFQNGVYDLQYILAMGIAPQTLLHDTMLLHHSLFPEMQKGLGFLGSIYTGESSWKLMRRHKPDSEKRDE